MNLPQTLEGTQVWDLAGRLGGQVRAAPGAVIGWDMGAALAMAQALAVPAAAVAELLPVIEGAMVRKVNERMREETGNGHD